VDEEEEANTDSITTNPPTASRIMPQPRETRQMPVFNVDKWGTMPENALKGNDAHKTPGKTKQPI